MMNVIYNTAIAIICIVAFWFMIWALVRSYIINVNRDEEVNRIYEDNMKRWQERIKEAEEAEESKRMHT